MKNIISTLMVRSLFLLLVFFLLGDGLLSQNCYQIIKSHSGMPDILYPEELEDKACELITAISPGSGQEDFQVFGYDFYRLLHFVDEHTGFDQVFNQVISTHEATAPHFLIIAKEHWKNGTIHYRTYLKLPNSEPFSQYNAIEKEAIAFLVHKEVDRVGSESAHLPQKNGLAEIAGMDVLLNILADDSQLFSSSVLIDAGFKVLNIEQNFNFQVEGSQYIVDPNVFDYAGIQVAPGELIRNKAIEAISQFSYGNPAVIMTTNGVANADTRFNAASEKFKNLSHKLIIWLHFEYNNDDQKFILYYKLEDHFTEEEALDFVETVYKEQTDDYWDLSEGGVVAATEGKQTHNHLSKNGQGAYNCGAVPCSPPSLKWRAYCCLLGALGSQDSELAFQVGVTSGIIDGLIETLSFIVDSGNFLLEAYTSTPGTFGWFGDILYECWKERSFSKGIIKKFSDDAIFYEGMVTSLLYLAQNGDEIINAIWNGIKGWFADLSLQSGLGTTGYAAGKLAFEVILDVLTGGTAVSVTALRQIGNITEAGFAFFRKISSKRNLEGGISDALLKSKATAKKVQCKILLAGCFVADTPVLMAGSANQFSLKNSSRAMVVAAVMPIVAVPIQEVQLLDYAVAHKTVNAGYGLTAGLDAGDSIYLGLTDKDPYTSDQQRQRDQYELDDENWNEVVFEEVFGSSTVKLALHNDWIAQKGYKVDAIVNMDLPEQGISGPFRITLIRHILPQKRPVDEDPEDNYDYRSVTGLFTHVSDEVYEITFANGEVLGVTYQHPIYSVTAGDWRFAGELEHGEQVLTKSGEATVVSSEKRKGSETVYNLEVKNLHNFLVGGNGVVVHNSCWNILKDVYRIFNIHFDNAIKLPGKNWSYKIRSSDNPLDFEIDFSEEIGGNIGKRIALAPENTEGFDAISEAGKVMTFKVMSGKSVNSNLSQLKDNLSTAINKYKKHHSDKELPVDIYVRGDHLTKEAALENWNIIKDINVPYTVNKNIIGKIFYKGPDGFIEFN